MQPDYSALFHRERIGPLPFRVRGLANHVHDVQFLSGYLHDARFLAGAVTRRGKRLRLLVDRDAWEPWTPGSELRTASSRLIIEPVSFVRWEANDPTCFDRELAIESVYIGTPHWENPEASEIVISAPQGGWRLCVSISGDFADIRLDDQETPRRPIGRPVGLPGS